MDDLMNLGVIGIERVRLLIENSALQRVLLARKG
jgi:hypothetical protein